MDMDLSPAYSGEKSLYLRAGAGYTLHPELDFTWTPVRGRKFRMSLYARHRSYIGKYRSVGLSSPQCSCIHVRRRQVFRA